MRERERNCGGREENRGIERHEGIAKKQERKRGESTKITKKIEREIEMKENKIRGRAVITREGMRFYVEKLQGNKSSRKLEGMKGRNGKGGRRRQQTRREYQE